MGIFSLINKNVEENANLVLFATSVLILLFFIFTFYNFLSSQNKFPAQEIRLIGVCNGQLLGAMEEDQFPYGCDWIEPINYEDNLS